MKNRRPFVCGPYIHGLKALPIQEMDQTACIILPPVPWCSYCAVYLWMVSPTAAFSIRITHALRWKQARDPRLAALNRLTYSVWISRGAGLALSLDTSLLLIPMCRETLRWLRPKMRWLRLEESEWFHSQVAYSLLLYTCIHVSAHYVK